MDRKDNIYIYVWKELNAVYVGRTVNPKSRHWAHKNRKTETTYKFSSEHHVEHPKMIIIENDLTIEEGKDREEYWRQYYINNTDMLVVNKVKCGTIGNLDGGKWTKESVFNEAKKYKTRSEFHKNGSGGYYVARINGWLDELFGVEKNIKPIRKWTKDALLEESKKYDTRYHFQTGNESAYKAALERNLLDEMPWLKVVGHLVKWDKESVLKESQKYTSRKKFCDGSPGAYHAALVNNWLDEMTWLKPGVKWTKEAIFEESKKHKTRTEFKRGNAQAYRLSIKKGWINEMDWLKPYSKYTKEEIFEVSKKYNSRNEFKHGSSMYQIALKNRWLDEMEWLKPKNNKKNNF